MMHETEMTRVNGTEDVQREGIRLCAIFDERDFLVRRVENSREGGFGA